MKPATSSWWSTGKNAPKSSDIEKNPDVRTGVKIWTQKYEHVTTCTCRVLGFIQFCNPCPKMAAAGAPTKPREDSAGGLLYGGAAITPRFPRAMAHAPTAQAPPAAPAVPLRELNVNSRRAGSGAPLVVDASYISSAGAPREVVQRTREVVVDRRQKQAGQDRWRMVDDYNAHVEDHTFNKLHASLGRLERKAEREHRMYDGAAGWSSEQLKNRSEQPEYRRTRAASPLPGAGRGDGMASILRDPQSVRGRPSSTPPSRASSPRLSSARGPLRERPQSPRGYSPARGRAASPRR
jgi:hypothetical protein